MLVFMQKRKKGPRHPSTENTQLTPTFAVFVTLSYGFWRKSSLVAQ